jgi:hypothetical protein
LTRRVFVTFRSGVAVDSVFSDIAGITTGLGCVVVGEGVPLGAASFAAAKIAGASVEAGVGLVSLWLIKKTAPMIMMTTQLTSVAIVSLLIILLNIFISTIYFFTIRRTVPLRNLFSR